MWNSFPNWLINRNAHFALLLRLSEVSELFDRQAFNALFDRELTGVIQKAPPEQRQQLERLREFDWIGYIDRSLRNAGFRDHDLDELTQEIVVKLLIQPGQLFRGWQGQPIDRRFKASLKNAIINLVEKRRNRRRLLPSVPIANEFEPGATAAQHLPSRQQSSGTLLDEFREFLRQQLGSQAVAVFDHRLEGRDTKELIGREGMTSYRIKLTVQAIKSAARQFAQGDTSFLRMVDRAMREEERTVGKRQVRQKEKSAAR
jgi:DNA-directed RNA polymerase specialized sigma24 family protein